MNGSGFGISSYPQSRSLSPDQVGAALSRMPSSSPSPMLPPQISSGSMAPADAHVPTPPPVAQGNSRNSSDPEPDPAIVSALQAATMRVKNRTMGRPTQPVMKNPRNANQLARLGMSLQEIQLHQMTGGS